MARRPNKTGRNPETHYVSFDRAFLETPAWRALSTAGKAIYPFVRLEWHGPNHNNNGKIRLSLRQAAYLAGVSVGTAERAFQDMQAKGFIFVTVKGCLGTAGEARGPSFEITENPLPGMGRQAGRRLFANWQEGQDFPVVKHNANNPNGINGKRPRLSKSGQAKEKTPSPKSGQERIHNDDVQ
jgi:hypothetical protein